MRVLRGIGFMVLYVLAGVGVLSGATWAATALGFVQPLIVVSGSMAPGIRTGDLILSVPTPLSEVSAGDVLTLTSPLTGRLVTHRVVTIDSEGTDGYRITMKGDANDGPDNGEYLVAGDRSVPTPWIRIPGAGRIVETLTRPGVSIPLLIALAALIGLATLPPRGRGRGEDADANAVPAPDDEGEAEPEVDHRDPSTAADAEGAR